MLPVMALDEPSRNLKSGVLDETSTFNSQPGSIVSQPQKMEVGSRSISAMRSST